MNWYLEVLRKYAVFSGRARRKEYWMFFLFNLIISFLLGVIDGVMGTFSPEAGLGLLGGIYSLAVLIPQHCRYHSPPARYRPHGLVVPAHLHSADRCHCAACLHGSRQRRRHQ